MHRILSRTLLGTAVALVVALDGSAVAAQTTYTACRVPDVGAIYMINYAGGPTACLEMTHVMFTWTESGGGVTPGSITEVELADGAVTTAKIADDAVGSSEVQDNSLTADDLAPNSVTQSEIATNAVNATHITAGAVGAAEIATGAVGTAEVEDGSLTTDDLASSVLTARGLAVVALDGTLLNGVNVVSVQRPTNGATAWTVTFNSNVDVSQLRFVLTPGITGTCVAAASAEDALTSAPANSVFVGFVGTGGGGFVDCGFALVVF